MGIKEAQGRVKWHAINDRQPASQSAHPNTMSTAIVAAFVASSSAFSLGVAPSQLLSTTGRSAAPTVMIFEEKAERGTLMPWKLGRDTERSEAGGFTFFYADEPDEDPLTSSWLAPDDCVHKYIVAADVDLWAEHDEGESHEDSY